MIVHCKRPEYNFQAGGLNLTAGTPYFAVVTGFENSDFGTYSAAIGGGPGMVQGGSGDNCNETRSSCEFTSQSGVNAAFAAWVTEIMDDIVVTGGCDPVVTNNSLAQTVPTWCTGGSATVTFTVTDQCESWSRTAVWTLEAAPVLTVSCPAPNTQAACQTQAAVDAAFQSWLSGFSNSGGCSPTATNLSTFQAPDACGGSVSITYAVSDICGQSASCTSTFSVTPDNVDPDFEDPADLTLYTEEDGATCPGTASISLTANQSIPVATGNDAFTYTVHGVTLDGPEVYSDNCSSGADLRLFVWSINTDFNGPANNAFRNIAIVWRVYDRCNNFTEQTQVIRIEDDTAPTVTCPSDQTVAADGDCEGTVGSWSAIEVTDNCTSQFLLDGGSEPCFFYRAQWPQ
jgi:hypothetical protein